MQIEPELILCSDYMDPEQEKLLNRIAPTIAVEFHKEWRLVLLEIAALLGKSEEANTAIERYDHKCLLAGEQLREALGQETVALLRVHAQELRLYGVSHPSYTGPVLYGDLDVGVPHLVSELALNEAWVNLPMSLLSELDADRLLLVIDPNSEEKAQELMNSQIWRDLKAVRNGHLYRAGYYTWMSNGIRMNTLKIEEVLRMFVHKP
ncbi:HTH-type transcriptional activator Btr [compost metagenome]